MLQPRVQLSHYAHGDEAGRTSSRAVSPQGRNRSHGGALGQQSSLIPDQSQKDQTDPSRAWEISTQIKATDQGAPSPVRSKPAKEQEAYTPATGLKPGMRAQERA